MAYDLSQFHQVFFDESAEHLATMESILLRVDAAAPDLEDLNAIFRAAHSMKGGAGTFGFTDIAQLTHVAETLLDRLRKQELRVETTMIDALLEATDVIRTQVAAHQAGDELDPEAAVAIRNRLEELSTGTSVAKPAPAPSSAPSDPHPTIARRYRIRFMATAEDAAVANLLTELRLLGELESTPPPSPKRSRKGAKPGEWSLELVTGASEAELRSLVEFVVDPATMRLEAVEAPAPAGAAAGEDFGFFEGAAGTPDAGFGFFGDPPAPAAETDAGFGLFESAPGTPTDDAGRSAGRRATDAPEVTQARAGRRETDKVVVSPSAQDSSSIRVSVEKVDQLINLVGELVITQSMIAQTATKADPAVHEALLNGIAQLERNSRDLQEAVMSIRMLPIAFVFSRFPRVVRDLAGKLGKQVQLKTTGDQTELDKGVIEKISDPLNHLVRNSLDHGIESPEDRAAAGKDAMGTVTLSAFHQGGSIVVEVADDGRGLDRGRILAKARERGMKVEDTMTDQEVYALIFEPGFSTAAEVTDVSGRGVGMDVVRRNIQEIGGRVEIASQAGHGSTISIRLPLTLAILDGISVAVGPELFIMPLTTIVESLQPEAGQIRTVTGSGQVMKVRDEYLPVLKLHELMGIAGAVTEYHRGIMVVLDTNGSRVAVLVDELVGQHQVVIKSIESNYRKVPGVSAATIMGDGRVAMILDAAELVRLGAGAGELRHAA